MRAVRNRRRRCAGARREGHQDRQVRAEAPFGREGLEGLGRQGRQAHGQARENIDKPGRPVVKRGRKWVKTHWNTLASYTKACFVGVIGAQAWEEVNGAINTLSEWRRWLSNPFHGPELLSSGFLNDGFRDLYYNPNFDFNKTVDVWRAACGAGIIVRGATG